MKRMKRIQYFGMAVALAAAVTQVCGCSGMIGALDGNGAQPGHASGLISGGLDSAKAALRERVTIPAGGSATIPSLIATLPDGQTTTLTDVVAPSLSDDDVTLDAGTIMLVIPKGTKSIVKGTFPADAKVSINRHGTNIGVNQNGVLAHDIVLPWDLVNGSGYTFSVPGGVITGRALNVGAVEFSGIWYYNGGAVISPLPTHFEGTIPNNGENAAGSQVTVQFGAGNNGRPCTLRVVYGNGFMLQQTQTIQNRSATFADLTTDTVNVPNEGVELVSFAVGPKP